MVPNSGGEKRVKLLKVLTEKFDMKELYDLCWDLSVDEDNLSGSTKQEKARSLIRYLENRNRVHELEALVKKLRPNAYLIDVKPHNGPLEHDYEIHEVFFGYLRRIYSRQPLRGFALGVPAGDLTSLPLAEIFLPLQVYYEETSSKQKGIPRVGKSPYEITMGDLLDHQRVVLLGGPGAGKTTIARYITYAIAINDSEHIGSSVSGLTPIMVPIGNYVEAYKSNPKLQLNEYIEHEFAYNSGFPGSLQEKVQKYLQEELQNGRCIIILDGLDEVFDTDLRIQITECIQRLIVKFHQNRYLVTSRIVGYNVAPMSYEFFHATLQGLPLNAQEQFVRKWYQAIENHTGKSSRFSGASDLVYALKMTPRVSQLAANPLLLTIMVLMHWHGLTLPNHRVSIYDNVITTLIGKGSPNKDAVRSVKKSLAPIAYRILSSNVNGRISEQDLLQLISGRTKSTKNYSTIPLQEENIAQERLESLKRIGLLVEYEGDSKQRVFYGFLHETFGEYLAALHMVSQMQDDAFDLSKHIYSSEWHESLVLMIDYFCTDSTRDKEANTLIRAILDSKDPDQDKLQHKVMLLADCLRSDLPIDDDRETYEKIAVRARQWQNHALAQIRESAHEICERLEEKGIKCPPHIIDEGPCENGKIYIAILITIALCIGLFTTWMFVSQPKYRLLFALNGFLQAQDGSFGVVVYDGASVDGEPTYEHSEDEPFPAGTLIHVPIAVVVFASAQEGIISLDETMALLETDKFVAGGGTIKNDQPGTRYTLRELCLRMLRDADSTAANILLRKLTIEKANAQMDVLGAYDTKIGNFFNTPWEDLDVDKDNHTTPDDIHRLLQVLRDGSMEGNSDAQGFLQAIQDAQNYFYPPSVVNRIEILNNETGKYLVILSKGLPDYADGVGSTNEVVRRVDEIMN